MDKNAVFAGRLSAYKNLVNFLDTINILGQKSKEEEELFE